MFNKKPILKYEPQIPEYPDSIKPSRLLIPEWYKKIPKWKDNEVWTKEKGIGSTVKHCMPFMEALSVGYMITLPYDIYVKKTNDAPNLVWRDQVEYPPGFRDEPASQYLVPAGHLPIEFTWTSCVAFSFPVGYSALFTHPLNRHDLPFTTLSGVIDGGFVSHGQGNIPFFLKQNFEGFIEQGTPIIQIIPFKQDSWKSQKIDGLTKTGKSQGLSSNLKFSGWYKRNFWVRKDYS
jgi:hypothetical protein